MPERKRFSNPFKTSAKSPKDLTMRQVLSVSDKKGLPSWKQWQQLPRILNKKEQKILNGGIALFLIASLALATGYVYTHRIEVPTVGGEYTEGLIGEPQFINPLYASLSDIDADLTRLVFSGLLTWKDGELVNDLAESIEKSEDGLVYTVVLKDHAYFHNGDPVRARDVLFTYSAIQNPLYRSPLSSNFRGVTIEQVDDRTIAFSLEEPHAPFESYLNIGILPANLWGDILPRNAQFAELNVRPIGSGPYAFKEFAKDKKGSKRSYTFERFERYHNDGPLLETLNFKFYSDSNAAAQALENKQIEGLSFVPANEREAVEKNRNVRVLYPSMPRLVTLYINQSGNDILKTPEVREAIAHAINKEALVEEVLEGHGRTVHHPILPGMLGALENFEPRGFDPELSASLLDDAGHPLPSGAEFRAIDEDKIVEPKNNEVTVQQDTNTLELNLVTIDSKEFTHAAELLQKQFAEIGIRLTIDTVTSDEIFSLVIQPREYELLLADAILGADPDPFQFWHSSGAGGEGLNLADYQNRNVDTLLEEARKARTDEERVERYHKFQEILQADIPAVFLYQSTYAYAVAEKLQNVEIERINTPADRFAEIASWYSKTKKSLRR